jgi:hypothetical protein
MYVCYHLSVRRIWLEEVAMHPFRALLFRARVDGKDVQGCDFLRHDQHGRVVHLTVMVRPLTAAVPLRDRMAAELARV